MAAQPGPGLRKLQETLSLNDAEVEQLASRYPDKDFAGPAEFVTIMSGAVSDPNLSRALGDRATKMKVELTDLLLKVKTVLLADGPAALDRYLSTHPFLKYLS